MYKDVTPKELLKNGLNSGNIISRILVNCTLYLLLCLTKFSNPSKMLSFAGLEPGIIESGTMSSKGKMVKRGSGYLRYSIMNVALTVIKFNPTFYDYYYKKISEGKCHRVALSHVCKKLIRVIYILETKNIQFDPSLLK